MAIFYDSYRRHRCRSDSAPPSPSAPTEREAIQRFVIDTRTSIADDLETVTYRETRHRKDVLSLVEDCSKECSATLHKVGWRKNMFRANQLVRRLTDTNIEYDQQLMYLDFHLAGPDRIHFLPGDDAEEAAASLYRAKTAIADAGWQMQRTAYLWNRRGSPPAEEKEGDAQTKPEPAVRSNRYQDLKNDALFWKEVRPQFDVLLEALREEVSRIRYVVYCLDCVKKQEVGYFQEGFSREEKFKRLLLCDFTPTIRSERRPVEMSGAIQADGAAHKKLTFVECLKVKFEKIKAHDRMAAEAPAGTWIRYKIIKHGDKRRSPEESIAAWAAFRQDLDSKSRPFNSGTALLRNKVETKIILAEHQLQQLADGNGANGDGDQRP
ncbi:hypothetical protein F4820DRAFT_425236 [Hypoxylon rubiginosum]|uniref:Uncharacterized protein n=1 Tax=Hypoxylon rubiginosum TaxID=110542 RepID=A0ACB9YXL6_9PEZI|nr:hypothetical protein F4820DRAFT_425236 [Hypoxylon rubiginosum]